MADPKILLVGAFGQLGTELASALADRYGASQVVLSDLRPQPFGDLAVETLDVTDRAKLDELIGDHGITQIYHLAAVLSAVGEQQPQLAWDVNMGGLLNVLEAGLKFKLDRVFWPSSIAVFGPHSPQVNTPQYCVMDPNTIYGISKQAGERLCEYYWEKRGLDVRSVRYPGLIGYNSQPGGGTTDYAVHIYYAAKAGEPFEVFLKEDAELPMLYMPDAVRGAIELMEAPAEQVRVRSSYNMAGMSFSPAEIAEAIRKYKPGFEVSYKPDFRQAIADSWPKSIEDAPARDDWGWKPDFDLDAMTADMLEKVRVEATNLQAL